MSEEVVATVVTETPVTVAEDQNTAPLEEGAESSTASTEAETTKPEQPPETEEQKRSKYQRRIDRKNAEIAAARTEARIFKERLEQLEAQARPQQPKDASAPRLEQYEDFESYMQARDDYVAAMAEKRFEAKQTKAQQEEAARKAQEKQSSVLTSWQDKQIAAAEKYADFEDVVSESDAPVTPSMSQAIVESDLGADIAYYLAQHPDEAKAIAKLSPIRQIAEIGKLEVKVSAPAVRKPTLTPPPVNPIGTKAKAEKNPDEMPYEQWVKWRNEQLKNR